MPLTKKGRTVLTEFKKEYGSEKGEEIFWKSVNAGKLHGVHKGKKKHKGK